jgi:hypothetical protein
VAQSPRPRVTSDEAGADGATMVVDTDATRVVLCFMKAPHWSGMLSRPRAGRAASSAWATWTWCVKVAAERWLSELSELPELCRSSVRDCRRLSEHCRTVGPLSDHCRISVGDCQTEYDSEGLCILSDTVGLLSDCRTVGLSDCRTAVGGLSEVL